MLHYTSLFSIVKVTWNIKMLDKSDWSTPSPRSEELSSAIKTRLKARNALDRFLELCLYGIRELAQRHHDIKQ